MDRQLEQWELFQERSLILMRAMALITGTLLVSIFSMVVLASPQPAKVLQGITIESATNGMWNDPATWTPAQVPGPEDQIIIYHTVTIDTDAPIAINSLHVVGALTGICDINFQITSSFRNDGLLQAGTAADRGCNINISASVITNYGTLQAGNAPDGCLPDGIRFAGGDVNLNAPDVSNYGTITGGAASQVPCEGEEGGGGEGHWVEGFCSPGGGVAITAEDFYNSGGNIFGGAVGYWEDVCIEETICWPEFRPLGGGDVAVYGESVIFDGGELVACWIWVEPPNILLAGDLTIEGVGVSVFGLADWTIAISGTTAGAPTISATNSIMLSTGSGGTIDLTGITTETEIFHVVSGTMSIQSDIITTTVPVSTIVSGNTPITITPSVSIYEVVIPSISRAYQTVKAGDMFTLSFRVKNIGNITDTYEVRFATQDPTWNLTPDTMVTQTLGIFEDVNLPVAVAVPANFDGGTNIISCTVNSSHTLASAATLISGCLALSPNVNFVHIPETIIVNKPVTFQVVPSMENLNYIWNFGDGRFGTGAQIIHSFGHEGTFSVTLQIENDCDTRTVVHEVGVSLYRIYLPVVLRNE